MMDVYSFLYLSPAKMKHNNLAKYTFTSNHILSSSNSLGYFELFFYILKHIKEKFTFIITNLWGIFKITTIICATDTDRYK